MKVKAAVVFETAAHPFTETQPLKIEEVDLDPPGPGEVLVKVMAAGLCHSTSQLLRACDHARCPMSRATKHPELSKKSVKA